MTLNPSLLFTPFNRNIALASPSVNHKIDEFEFNCHRKHMIMLHKNKWHTNLKEPKSKSIW